MAILGKVHSIKHLTSIPHTTNATNNSTETYRDIIKK